MADDDATSPDRNRPAEEPAEVRLARELIRTEYRLRDQRRRGEHGAADAPGARERLSRLVRRFLDRLSGRPSPAARDGAVAGWGAEPGGPGQPDPARTFARAPAAGAPPQAATGAAHPDVARLERRIGRLPTLRHEAFEDAVLRLLRTDERWRTAFERSPESMPTVARYTANAHMREALREPPPAVPAPPAHAAAGTRTRTGPGTGTRTAAEALDAARDRIMAADARQFAALRARWERTAAGERPDTAPVPQRNGFDGPGQDPAADGQAFDAARRAQWARLGTGATASPGGPTEVLDGDGFRAAAEAQRDRLATSPTAAPRATDVFDGHAFLAAEHAARQAERAPYAAGHAAGVPPGPPPSPAAVSPSLPAAPPSPLLGSEGHAAVRGSLDTLRPSPAPTAPGTPGSPASSHRPAPVHRPTTPDPSQKRGRT
ncbi:hypothetical protein SUDANB108_05729 [Streptomyces sp. enrichment culture]|uniref:hypothetical protein n=1 Tax=Streptomyces sp. enrichment culture TaxID=1795815 RepID=UPI003F57FB53